MNNLRIDNHIISKDIKGILSLAKGEINTGKLGEVCYKGNEVSVTCPFHSDGMERKPSCFIYVGDDEELPWGTFHCFACGEKGSLIKFLSGVFDSNEYYVKSWLKRNFTERIDTIGDIDIEGSISFNRVKLDTLTYMNESILNKFQKWHPYIEQRHISPDIAKRFDVGYDPLTESIVFPVRDKSGKLLFLTRRSVREKIFHIDPSASKVVYLLDEVFKNNYKEVIVVESQINALVSYSYGFPAVALFGAGTTDNQMDELNHSPIFHYILMYDNDEAGRKGANRFKKLIRKDVLVDDILMPYGKDVADLSKEEFLKLLKSLDK